ncbi:MAG TPA: aminotransferase class I/II-fold pyridoxal phosphate-dependent enzyme [Acidimicrobiia bacterium]|nr:aminotransferase class I/II-fold pyridoxal phosphate-dependent enzyme [Acidimicrobiia bacterium]
MSGYQPPHFSAPIDLDLSRNEGRPTLRGIDLDAVTVARLTSRYPDTTRLTGLVAERHDVDPRRVLVTAGGDDALFRCFLRAEGTVAATTPTFEMIARYAEQAGLNLIEVPWWDGDFPIADFLDVDAGMAVIVSPNNPTGSVISAADLRKVAADTDLVVLDAAYSDFAAEDLTPVALELDNVVVVRTLSKAYGLAGLRVGYLLGPEGVVDELRGFGSPYSLSALSASLAADVLETQAGWAGEFARRIEEERGELTSVLSDLGISYLPSQANFVLLTNVDPMWLVPAAASLGIALRWFPDRPELARCVRVTLPGDPDDFSRLIQTLRAVLAPEALIFDMDGVLAEVRGSFRAAIIATAAGYDVDVTPAQIAAAKAAGNASDDWELTRRLLAAAGVDVSLDDVRDRFETLYQGEGSTPGLKAKESLIPGRSLLEAWATRMSLGIVTARPRKDAEEFLRRFDLTGLFAAVVTREDAPSKPDPAPVRLALQRLGVRHAWMAGDTRDDIEAARGAGVVPIGVSVSGDEPLTGAALVVSRVEEIQEVLDVTKG